MGLIPNASHINYFYNVNLINGPYVEPFKEGQGDAQQCWENFVLVSKVLWILIELSNCFITIAPKLF